MNSDIEMDDQGGLDWHHSAAKYYQCSRILFYVGYTKQAYNLLCTSIEKFLKVYISLRDSLSEGALKKYGHNIDKLFDESTLEPSEYRIITTICKHYNYNEVRYSFEMVGNQINLDFIQLDSEIRRLSEMIILAYNKKYNSNVLLDRWPVVQQDYSFKKKFIIKALTSRDCILRMDFT